MIHDDKLYTFKLFSYYIFVLEDVSKSTMIPLAKFGSKDQQLLVHDIHFRSTFDLYVGPPIFISFYY